jgi:hypothetical protein
MNAARLAIAVVAVPGLAHASPEADVTAVVQATIDHLADGPTTIAKDATVIGIRANVFEYGTGKRVSGTNDGNALDFTTHGRLWPMIMDKADPAASKRALGKVAVIVDGQTAWFQAPLQVAPTHGAAQTFHVSGVATADGKGAWSIRVFQAGATLSDSELARYVVLWPWDHAEWPATKEGTQEAAIISWFQHHTFAGNAATGGALAGGSAPDELAADSAAVKLAATFDHITNMRATDIRTTDDLLVATGSALWLNKTERDGEVEFGFAVYAVKDHGAWKWRSLQFFSDQYPRM